MNLLLTFMPIYSTKILYNFAENNVFKNPQIITIDAYHAPVIIFCPHCLRKYVN